MRGHGLAPTASAAALRAAWSARTARCTLRRQRTRDDPHRAVALDNDALRRLITTKEPPHNLLGVATRRNRRGRRKLDDDLRLLLPVRDLKAGRQRRSRVRSSAKQRQRSELPSSPSRNRASSPAPAATTRHSPEPTRKALFAATDTERASAASEA